jgi:hypothetical protein
MSSRDVARHLTAALSVLALAAVALGGCGKKGPPQPPLRYVPAPTKDLAVAQRGTDVLLSFSYPKTTPSGLALNGLSSIEVWELDRPAPPAAPPAPPPAAAPPATGAPAATPGTAKAPSTAAAPATGTTAAAAPAAGTTAAAPPAAPPGTAPAKPAAGAPATPAVGAPSVPPPPSALPGGFPPIDPREFTSMAKLKLKIQGPDIAAVTLGDKVTITLPLTEPLLAPGAAGAAAAPAGAAGPSATAAAGSTAKSSTGATSGSTAGSTAGKPVAGKAAAASPTGTAATPLALVHYYAVRTTGPKGDRSAFSNQAALLPKPPPPPPVDIRLTPRADGIEVAWTFPPPAAAAGSPPKIAGFNVYRRDASAKVFGPPLRAAFPDARSIVDTTARFGESYIYSVTSIADPNPLRESAIQSEVEVKYVDRFPPPPPTDVVALAEGGKVRVVWRASVAPDLAGYLVYRRAGSSGSFQKLTAQPIPDVQYLDGSVAVGATYTYRVTAVDKSGNESAPGEAQTRVQ